MSILALTVALGASSAWGQTEDAVLQKKAEAFVAAFNKGDAKTLAGFYTPAADVVNTEGQHLRGRPAIEEAYRNLFARTKGARLLIQITNLRQAGPSLALEDGLTEVQIPGSPPSAARYSIVYVKQGSDWLIESVREAIAVPPTNSRHLEDLAFLLGNWSQVGDKGGSRGSYAWAEHGNFLVNHFELAMHDISVGGGVQWIGWDASIKKPRSWSFAFNGSFAEAVWSKDGDQWKVALTAVLPDGRKMSATNVYKKIDADHFSFQLTHRSLDGKSLPDEPVIQMKRVK